MKKRKTIVNQTPEDALVSYVQQYCAGVDGVVCDYRSRHLGTRLSSRLNLPLFAIDEAAKLDNPVQVIEFCCLSSSLIDRGHIVALRIEDRMRKPRYPYVYSPEVVYASK